MGRKEKEWEMLRRRNKEIGIGRIKSPINRDRSGDPGITTFLQSHALPTEL
jgi:hypothetical protein